MTWKEHKNILLEVYLIEPEDESVWL